VPPSPDPTPTAGALLRDVAAHDLAGRVVALASATAGCPVGLYVVDIAGSELRRVVGPETLPAVFAIPRAIGPEIPRGQAAEIEATLREIDADLHVVPLWLRHRAIAVLVCAAAPRADLDALAREAAAAVELIDGYTDQFADARRREQVKPAAQLQQDLLPPRITAARGIDLAATILPAYDVGGDWFDHAASASGAWLALGDAVGKGPRAASLSALAVAALRSVRQSGGTLVEAARAMHHALLESTTDDVFMTTILAEWSAADHVLSWINCGHPPPLLHRAGAPTRALAGPTSLPIGIDGLEPDLRLAQARLAPGDQILLYSDGVSERRRSDGGLFGIEGINAVLDGEAGAPSATGSIVALQRAVVDAAPDAVRDDATMLALLVLADDEHEPSPPGAASRPS